MKNLTCALLFVLIIPVLIVSGCGGGDTFSSRYPDIVLLLIDTARADHLSINGYYRETTPVLDSLASSGTIWTRVQAQSSWTLPAMTTIMTGLSQRSHGAGYYNDTFYGIDTALPTVPLMIKRGAGYQTAAFFNVVFMNKDFGFHQGFDHFDCQGFPGKASLRNAEETVNDFLEWYDAYRDPTKPLFSAVHFFDPHLPYSPPPPWDTLYSDPKSDNVFNIFWGRRNDVLDLNQGLVEMNSTQLEIMVGLYDAELAFMDSQIGRLISELEARGTLQNTVFVIVGDHGEEFLDHGGFGHGHTLYQEILNVPLIISGRNIPIGLNDEVVAQVDILPTILGISGLDIPIWVDGKDILSTDSPRTTRYITSSNLIWATPDMAAVRLDNMVVIGNPQEVSPVLYDLRNDPDERNPLVPGRETIDQLYYYWSLPPKGHPASVPFAHNMGRML
ncbi:MAG: sulfatase-like hydrolase/transferase [Candidatus Aegiribacteria sp.]|nr:sulfatase-like hydrolase/transferase [Candidatus Aegiribacteria sp.]